MEVVIVTSLHRNAYPLIGYVNVSWLAEAGASTVEFSIHAHWFMWYSAPLFADIQSAEIFHVLQVAILKENCLLLHNFCLTKLNLSGRQERIRPPWWICSHVCSSSRACSLSWGKCWSAHCSHYGRLDSLSGIEECCTMCSACTKVLETILESSFWDQKWKLSRELSGTPFRNDLLIKLELISCSLINP